MVLLEIRGIASDCRAESSKDALTNISLFFKFVSQNLAYKLTNHRAEMVLVFVYGTLKRGRCDNGRRKSVASVPSTSASVHSERNIALSKSFQGKEKKTTHFDALHPLPFLYIFSGPAGFYNAAMMEGMLIGRFVTKDKFPLIVDEYYVPYLLPTVGKGNNVYGEVWNVRATSGSSTGRKRSANKRKEKRVMTSSMQHTSARHEQLVALLMLLVTSVASLSHAITHTHTHHLSLSLARYLSPCLPSPSPLSLSSPLAPTFSIMPGER